MTSHSRKITSETTTDTELKNVLNALDELPDTQVRHVLARLLMGRLPDDQLINALQKSCNGNGARPAMPGKADTSPSDKRSKGRRKVRFAGSIVFNERMSAVDAVVMDISETGCRLRVKSTIGIPDDFTLVVARLGGVYECEVLRRSSGELGVKFIVTPENVPGIWL